MAYWQTTSFWDKIKYSFVGLVLPAEAVMFLNDTSAEWKMIVGGIALGGAILSHLIGVWMTDEDNNGKVDILERRKHN